ncbi:oxidoreductase, 2OG-Fe(II) oxygenase family [Pochonia chlamydosporia 170]|uniref:Oxidoreductase, 2OG-Fe(II) oxygenase family n=1 Tax=Pochonia chlamydosporia 170 TaxID=1380566 RepID=A0A179G0J8_METCM|nr:oxidoreductase, 2OG-Fe(II) oxygenase family [Pochonia chlamydosporia 170]OAQ71372.1 oxidoreductase, 2OG-Fe(II) oxygenase family [Pochonia chlamydosporia 170]
MAVSTEGDERADPVARLKTIRLQALKSAGPEDIDKLVVAATHDGIFYLSFEDDHQLSRAIAGMQSLGVDLFSLDMEHKMGHDIDKLGQYKLNGYKPIGRNVGGIKGQRDGFESYSISRNTISSLPDTKVSHLEVINEYNNTLVSFTAACSDIANMVFKILSQAFNLQENKSLESCHDASKPTLDIVRLLKYPSSIGNNCFSIPQTAHTDVGSLTFLYSESPGLQILPAGSKEWRHVIPKQGHLMVNFGDAMKTLSNGRLESVMHRVVTVPGTQVLDRHSFAFMIRPRPENLMTALPGFREADFEDDGQVLTCEEWVARKFKVMRGDKDEFQISGK